MNGEQLQSTQYCCESCLRVWFHLVLMVAALLLLRIYWDTGANWLTKGTQLGSDGDTIEIQGLRFQNTWIPYQYNIGKIVILVT